MINILHHFEIINLQKNNFVYEEGEKINNIYLI